MISVWGRGGHRSSAKSVRIEAPKAPREVHVGCGEGCSLSTWGEVWGAGYPPQNSLNAYIKMASCRAFRVAISYRSAACFTRIGSTVRVGFKFIGDRSSILWTVITPSKKLRAKKTTKIRQQLQKIALFFWHIFRIYSLKIFNAGEFEGNGHGRPQVALPLV